MSIRVIIITTILFTGISVNAGQNIGKNLYLYGDSAISLGRAGTGVSSFGTDLFYLNPASIADAERIRIGLNYGTLPIQTRYCNPDISISVPTSYGVIGASVRYLYIPHSVDFKRGYGVSVGAAKHFTPRIILGMSLNFFYGLADGNIFYTGATIGSIYSFSGSKGIGFGLFEPRAGFAVNFGIPFGIRGAYSNFNTLTIGYNFIFYRRSKFNFSFFNDITALNYKYFPVKAGIEAELFKRFTIRAGFILPNEYDYGDATGGLGYKFETENLKGSFNYAFNHYKDLEFVHYLGLNLEYGELDRKPPETAITPDNRYFSPNFDGANDYVHFSLDVKDKSRIKGWRLQIAGSDNKVIREFRISERDIIDSLTLKGFFKRFFRKKEFMVVPERVMWDGTDKNGDPADNGRYTYSFYAWDERDNIAVQKRGVVVIDKVSPEVSLGTKEDLFSPNNDKRKDTFIISQNIKSSPEDEWIAGFKNSEGKIVRKYTWKGDQIPNKIIWDGVDDNGADLPEGLYTYEIFSKDKAGNTTSAGIKEISLTRKYETADITISAGYFSNKINRDITFFPRLSDKKGLEKWKITIADSDRDIVKEIKGEGVLPKIVEWDCRDSENDRLDDGEYYIKLSSVFKSGNNPVSFEKKLIIDSTPPDLDISHTPDLFSPDSDGENDVLTLFPEAEDDFKISEWRINIYAPSGDIFKSYSGKGNVPKELKWDGLGQGKDIVESAADYLIELEAVDFAGNKAVSERDRAQIDILVVVTERGLKMRVSNIEFAFGSDTIKKKGTKILDRVSVILERYANYDVIVEGHTDDIGRENYNLELSERRAGSVFRYLVDNGIREERLQFMGMGESVPLYPNNSDENRRRNRRVEFLLIKVTDNSSIDNTDSDTEDK